MARDQITAQRSGVFGGARDQKAQRGCVRLPFVSGVFVCLAATVGIAEFVTLDSDEARDGRRLSIVKGEDDVGTLSLAVASQGALLATTDTAGRVSLRSEATGWHINEYVEYSDYAMSVAFSSDGRSLAIGGRTSMVVVQVQSHDGEQKTEMLPIKRVRAIAFSPDGRCVATASDGSNRVVVWDRAQRRPRLVLESRMPIPSLAFSPDGRTLAAGEHGDRASISLWDTETGRARFILNGSRGPVVSLAYSPDGQTLASVAMYEKGARVWETSTGRLRRTLSGHPLGTNSIAFSPNGRTLASVGNDGMVRLWCAATGKQKAALDGQTFRLNRVAFSPDGRRVFATGSADDDMRVIEFSQPGPVEAVPLTTDVKSVKYGGVNPGDSTISLLECAIEQPID